jgi:hypothetical protein
MIYIRPSYTHIKIYGSKYRYVDVVVELVVCVGDLSSTLHLLLMLVVVLERPRGLVDVRILPRGQRLVVVGMVVVVFVELIVVGMVVVVVVELVLMVFVLDESR